MNNITKSELELQNRLNMIIKLYEHAISTIEQYKGVLFKSGDKPELLKDLEHGQLVLRKHIEAFVRGGIKKIENDIKKPKGQRPGLGLSRGFGEFLYATDEIWVEEVVDAIRQIERYYANM